MSDRTIRCPFACDPLEVRHEPLGKTLWTSLEENGSKLALVEVETGQSVTYDHMKTRASLVARRLLAQGCRPGDVLAIFSPNSITWVVVYIAVTRIGAIPAPVNALLTAREMESLLRLSDAKFVFTTSDLASQVLLAAKKFPVQAIFLSGSDYLGCVDIEAVHRVGEQLPCLPPFESLNIDVNGRAFIYFSSGTTGPQKAVVKSHMNIQHVHGLLRHPTFSAVWPVQVVFAPLSHIAGSVFTFYSVVAGLTTHLLRRFDLDNFLRTIEENQIKGVHVLPPVAVMMVKSPVSAKYRLSSLKEIACGAAPLTAELEDQLLQKYPGVSIRQMFGMTETSAFISLIPHDNEKHTFPRKPGSSGVPVPNATIKVIDVKTGEGLGPKENGEICVKSPLVMLGYLNNPDATASAIDKDGYLHTGDVGYYDEDCYIYIVDRLKELIKYNAYQVAPSELEAILLSHPEVADAGVVGLPDPSAGELPLAWVVRKPNATVTELQLQQFVNEKVAPFKKLRGGVHFVSAIPKSGSGKILRQEMKAALLNGKQ